MEWKFPLITFSGEEKRHVLRIGKETIIFFNKLSLYPDIPEFYDEEKEFSDLERIYYFLRNGLGGIFVFQKPRLYFIYPYVNLLLLLTIQYYQKISLENIPLRCRVEDYILSFIK